MAIVSFGLALMRSIVFVVSQLLCLLLTMLCFMQIVVFVVNLLLSLLQFDVLSIALL